MTSTEVAGLDTGPEAEDFTDRPEPGPNLTVVDLSEFTEGQQITATGWDFPEDQELTYTEWAAFGSSLLVLDSGYQFVLGDWFSRGDQEFGEDARMSANVMRFDYKRLDNARRVAELCPPDIRREGLHWTHHRIVADLPTIEDRDEALQVALDQKLTTRELEAHVKELKGGGAEEEPKPGKTAKGTTTFTLKVIVGNDDAILTETFMTTAKSTVVNKLENAGVVEPEVTFKTS